MAKTESRSPAGTFGGYYHRDVPDEDEELTHVGPGTPCGEYLRRFWHPVGASSTLKDLPRAIRILGEDLVLFRDGNGQVGLLELHCMHRGTSLEFGTVEREGIRCCYHGWLYGADGRVLDTPGEPVESTFKERLFHGAYPTREHMGLVFAYMGPPEKRPELPTYDIFDWPGYRADPGPTGDADVTPCNWLQLAENNMDAVHTAFLHGLEAGRAKLERHRPSVDPEGTLAKYVEVGLKEWERDVSAVTNDMRARALEWRETPSGMMYIHALRAGEMVWVRLADYILPTIDQIPRTLPLNLLSDEMAFDPPRTTTWAVPVDDTHTTSFWLQYRPESFEGRPPSRWQFTSMAVRTYEDRQRQPGDYEGQVSQRPIAVHALEHLGWSDTGVLTVRKLLREGIRAVQLGEDPKGVDLARNGPIATYGQSTIVRVPPAASADADREQLREVGRSVFASRHSRAATPA